MEIHCFQRGRRTLELFIHVCNVTTVLKYCTVTTKVSVVLLLQQQIVLDQSWDVSRDCKMHYFLPTSSPGLDLSLFVVPILNRSL